jgi:DnaJ-class molecular chaperone
VTHEHKQRFLKLKEAYDVLSDPKRKKIYDEYGLSGLKLLENPADMNHLDLLRNFQVRSICFVQIRNINEFILEF